MGPINRRIVAIALPAIVSNVTVPLLGLVDSAISGHLGNAAYIGAVAVGAMMFNLIYWLMGFLRMGTSGMTSQALGRGDEAEVGRLRQRALLTGLAISLVLLALCIPLREVLLWLMQPSAEVATLTRRYFNIAVWGAPAMLPLYGLTGWYIGLGDTRRTMVISIVQNLVNICASLLLVFGIGMTVEGVALGTVVAQWSGLLLGMSLIPRQWRGERAWPKHLADLRSSALLLGWKGDTGVFAPIFGRTLLMVGVMFFFTSVGARQNDTVLAVNSLLMHFSLLFSYAMDGFAYAAEALCGRYYGAGDAERYGRTVRSVFVWAAVLVVLFSCVYAIGGLDFLRLLTDDEGVVRASAGYLPWAVLLPACGAAAFVWDGVFVGTTRTRELLLASVVGSVVFFAVFASTTAVAGRWTNHCLWLSYLLFLLMRGAVQTVCHWRRTIFST